MTADYPDFQKALYLIQGSYPLPAVAADFPDWTDGVFQVTGTIPAGADFPDWTKAIGVTGPAGVPGGPTLSSNFTVASATTTNTVTVNAPTGIKEGDLLVAVYQTGIQHNTMTPPDGWTEVADFSSTASFTMSVSYKLATASEPSFYTFISAAGSTQYVVMGRYTGVTVIDTPVNTGFGNGGTATAGTVSPSLKGEVLVAVFAAGQNITLSTPASPAGFALEINNPSAAAPIYWFDQTYNSQAATGPISSTLSVAGFWSAVAFFLR